MIAIRFPRVDGVFIGIFLLASLFRLWHLGTIPSGVLGDEAGIGYTAYSLLNIGRSPYGDTNPFALHESWGGSRPPLYIYSVIPSVAMFGLTPFAIRLPSAIYGILSVVLFYLLLRRLFPSRFIARVGAFLFAVNPWAIHISRQALLESIALFLVLAGIYAFIAAKERIGLYVLSAVCFIASLFAYDAPKIFLPPFIVMLVIFWRKQLIKIPKTAMLFVGLLVLGYVFMYKMTFVGLQEKDFGAVSMFRWKDIARQVDTERYLTTAPLWASRIVHNKATVAIKMLVTNIFSIFSVNKFFVSGFGNLQQSIGSHGAYYLFELPLFLYGAALALLGVMPGGLFFLLWMLIAALPGGMTISNNPLRAVLLLPVPLLLSSVGSYELMRHVKKFSLWKQKIIGISIGAIVSISILSYGYIYFFDYPVYASEWWSKQQGEALQYIIANQHAYPHVFVNGQWRVMYAFFARSNPKDFLASVQRADSYRGIPVSVLDGVTFGGFGDAMDKTATLSAFFPKGSLLILEGDDSTDEKVLQEFRDPGNVRVIYRAVEVK